MRDAKRDVRAERERDAITTQEERVRGPAGGHDAYLREAGGVVGRAIPPTVAPPVVLSLVLLVTPTHRAFRGRHVFRSSRAAERASERASERAREGLAGRCCVCDGDRHLWCGEARKLTSTSEKRRKQPSPARVEETTGGSQRAARLAALNIGPARATHARPRWWSGGSQHAAARTQLADDLHAAGDRDHTEDGVGPSPLHTRASAPIWWLVSCD